jgi:hypothetical protein
MFIGEAPGANEDLQGEPFVGRAGMLLNAMLKSIGLKRDDIYIANILKCRPPDNRDPLPEEVKLCTVPKCTLYPYRLGKRPENFKDIIKKRKEKVKTGTMPIWLKSKELPKLC